MVIAAEAAATGVGIGEPVEGGLVGWVEVDAVFQDGLDGAVLGVVEGECAPAGRFQTLGAEAPGEPDDALCGAQVVQDVVSEQPLDEGVTGRPDVLALTQTPLGVAQLVGERLGREVLVDGRAAAGPEPARMGGDELVVAEQLHGGLGGPQPQALAYQAEAGRVVGLLELNVAVGMELHLRPHGELGWTRGERAQELALGLHEPRQGSLVGGAVDAVAGRAEQPGAKLRIGVDEIAELAKRYERALDVLHRRLHPALGEGCQLQPIRTVSSRLYASPTPSIRCSGVASSC